MKHHLQGEQASRRVWLDGQELKPGPSQRIWNHSPDGFNWGYGGSGPAQLALAILLQITRDREVAWLFHQEFKRAVVAIVPQEDLDVWFDLDLTRQPPWSIVPRHTIRSMSGKGSRAPVIEPDAPNPATLSRSDRPGDPPPWCAGQRPYCPESDCTECPRG